MIKTAQTEHAVIDLIRNRWSARSFSSQAVSEESMDTLLEAASWAPSAGNEQPWLYYYAFQGTEGFQQLWECLDGGNRPWCKNAAVLAVSVYRKTKEKDGGPNATAMHDTGLANSLMFMQAISMNIYTHPMAGYEPDKVKELLKLDDTQGIACMIAIGYLDDAEKLPEPFKTREITPRTRKNILEVSTRL
jgi:nitroreductase